MRLAELLTDLTTLSPEVCDPKAASALVNVRPEGSAAPASTSDDEDIDLKRAKDLLQLHADVKLAHGNGVDEELNDARHAVEVVLREL
ncbi:hypothetical protein B0A48_13860 [Cryoendolithus antarcticus]|uniref:Uncharacterized protein n=1 Tax=Cryoendolithus antarcticus TaxID=1507870 RepID=A0A1V8SN58_9PEZI|nr:hypothetical protein B0A48_13860 [Cryoendolithus antarcticus]